VIKSPLRITRENETPSYILGGMKYMMSTEELGKRSLIRGAIDGVYTVREAVKRLKLSERHVKRLKRRVRE
jgi:hypothetical protein